MAKKTKIEGWRKIAAATWKHPNDPQIFGDLEIDATAALEFIEDARSATDVKLSITHLVGKSLAHAFDENPDLNVRLHKSHFVQRDTIDIFFIVSMSSGSELSGVKVVKANEKPVVEIARELAERANRIRSGNDAEFGKTKKNLSRTPRRLLHMSLKVAA